MFEYYYNNVPIEGLCRNNLVYTSKIDRQNNLFSVHYTYDQVYHNNQCLDQKVLDEKWKRELKYTMKMLKAFPQHVLQVKEIDDSKKEIIFNIEGNDFWELANCNAQNYDKVLPDWQDQALEILRDYRRAGIWKFSLHPSSFFIVNGKLKSINHFFCYSNNEPEIAITEVLDHVSQNRQNKLDEYLKQKNIDPNHKFPYLLYGQVALDSFAGDYPIEFIEKAKRIYV